MHVCNRIESYFFLPYFSSPRKITDQHFFSRVIVYAVREAFRDLKEKEEDVVVVVVVVGGGGGGDGSKEEQSCWNSGMNIEQTSYHSYDST